ncbi:MAG: hypothetical protein NTZ24_07655 [Deltaproteobacteria bacterium]|nr:hypothetical protein [Deltaproteobacteria bacterium]
MKRAEIIYLLLLLLILTLAGCATMDDLKGSVTSRVASITSNVDPALVAKVPGDKRGEFPKAEFSITVAQEKLKLAQMKSDLAEKQKKYADFEEDLVNIDLKDAGLDYDIVKLGAIDATGLGKKEDNVKTTTNLKLKKVDLQADRIRADAKMPAIKQQIADLTEKIKAQDEKVKGLKMEKATPEKEAKVSTEKIKEVKGDVAAEKSKEEPSPVATEKTK